MFFFCWAKKKSVTRRVLQAWLQDEYDIDVSVTTVGNMLDEGGFSYRMANTRNPGRFLSDVELGQVYRTFLSTAKRAGFFNDTYWVIDFTYNSQRRYRVWSYGVRNAEGPIVDDDTDAYTDCFVALVSSDGDMIGPYMFTADPAFDRHRDRKVGSSDRSAEVSRLRKEYSINPSQIVYWGEHLPKGKRYVYESHAIVEYLKGQDVFPNGKIFRDGSVAFSKDGNDLLADGGRQVLVMPSEVHADMSPLDNGIWGRAKSRLAASGVPRSDHVSHSLRLMREVMSVPGEHIDYCFAKNFLRGVPRPTVRDCIDAMRGDWHKLYSFHRQCEYEYKLATSTTSERPPDSIYDLHSALDGPYWD